MDKTTRTDNGQQYPKEAYLYTPSDHPASWKLRVWESPEAKVTRVQLGRAAAALSPGGFRGQKVDIPSADLPAVKAKLLSLYKSLDVQEADIPPHVLKESAHPEEVGRWYGQYRQRLTEAGAAHTKAEIAIIDNLMAGHDAMKGQLQTLRRIPKLHPAAEAMKRAYAGTMQETMVHAEGSLDQRICDVKDAYYDSISIDPIAPTTVDQPFIEEVFDDHLIVSKDDEYFTIPYTMATDGTVSFGDPSQVDPKLTYEPSTLQEYSEDQPRADNGQWSSGGSSGSSGQPGDSGGGSVPTGDSRFIPPIPSELPTTEKTITWQPNGPKDGTTLKATISPRGDGHEIKYGVNVQRTLDNGKPATGAQAQERLTVQVGAVPDKGWVGQISGGGLSAQTFKGTGTLKDGLSAVSSHLVGYAKALPTYDRPGMIGGSARPAALVSPSGGEILRFKESDESVVSGQEDAHLLESKSTDGSEWVVRLIRPGWSKNTSAVLKLPRYYPESTLREAAPRFEGVRAFAHNNGPHVADPSQRRAQDVVGWFSAPAYDKGVCATFTCIDQPLRTKLKEAWDKGKRDLLGFSIDAPGREEPRLVEGRRAAWVSEIQTPYSTDVVTDPAAGGELMRLVASADGPQKEDDGMERLLEMIRKINPALVASPPDGGWTDDKLQVVLQEAMAVKPTQVVDVTRLAEVENKLAELNAQSAKLTAKQHIRESLAVHSIAGYHKAKVAVEGRLLEGIDNGKTYTDEQIKAVADEQVTILAEASETGKVKGLGGVASVTQEEREKMTIHAMDGLFDGQNVNSVPRFTSLHEAYCRITGKNYFDLNNRAIFQECLGSRDYDSANRRLTESITTADWSIVFGDSVTRKLIRDYNQASQFDAWRSIVSEISSPKDFRTQRRERIGGYGTLPAVSQGAPYQPLTSPTNEEVTYTPSKRGGTEDLTWEDILNDDIGAIRRVPIALARAAKITLYRFVMDLFRTNPTIYDGAALFSAGHANIETQAFAAAGLLIAENDMLAQSAYSEANNNLGLTPHFLVVVRAIRDVAWKLTTGDTSVITNENATTPNIFKGKYKSWNGNESGEPFHVLNYETSATAWWLIADPQQIPTIEVGFLGGQQEPELFVQDDERVGARFSADKITYKLRHVYSGAILDYRGFVRGNA